MTVKLWDKLLWLLWFSFSYLKCTWNFFLKETQEKIATMTCMTIYTPLPYLIFCCFFKTFFIIPEIFKNIFLIFILMHFLIIQLYLATHTKHSCFLSKSSNLSVSSQLAILSIIIPKLMNIYLHRIAMGKKQKQNQEIIKQNKQWTFPISLIVVHELHLFLIRGRCN